MEFDNAYRVFVDQFGCRVRLRLTPVEGDAGLNKGCQALCFETEDGAWIGSVLLPANTTMLDVGRDEIEGFLSRLNKEES